MIYFGRLLMCNMDSAIYLKSRLLSLGAVTVAASRSPHAASAVKLYRLTGANTHGPLSESHA